MDCQQAQLLINARIDCEIAAADQTLLQAHLATCGECRETHETLRAQDGSGQESSPPTKRSSRESRTRSEIGRTWATCRSR